MPVVSETFRVGPATFAIEGTDRVARLARAMFSDAAAADVADVNVRLRVAPADEIDDAVRSMTSRHFPYRFDTTTRADGVRWRMCRRGGQPLITVDLTGLPVMAPTWSATATLHVPQLLARLVPSIRLPAVLPGHQLDHVFVTLLTDVLEPLMWLHLLDHGSMLLHGGAARSPSGDGVLLIGASHAGKTATVLELAVNRGWDFVGDDLVIVGADGVTRLPKSVRLRQHHARLVDNLPAAAFRGRRGAVRRQVSPSVLMPPARVAADASVSTVIRMVTTTDRRPEVVTLPREAMIHQAVAGMFDEYWHFMRGMNSIAAIDERATGLGALYDRTCAALGSAIGDGPVYELQVPIGTPAVDIADVVVDIVG